MWQNPEEAQKIMRERTVLEKGLSDHKEIEREFEDSLELLEIAESESDETMVKEVEGALEALHKRAAKMELESLLSGEADANDCYLEVHAGAGGTESQDWAEMLVRMYVRWAEARGFKINWIEESLGEEAGIKSATVRVEGHNA